MRRPDNKIYFWASPLSTYTENRHSFQRFQDCAKPNIEYSVNESVHSVGLSHTDINTNKTIRISYFNRLVNSYIDVAYMDPLGNIHVKYDQQGDLMHFTYYIDIVEEKLKLVVDFTDGNQWYIYQYEDPDDIDKIVMIDRDDNIPDRTEFSSLKLLTSLVSHHRIGIIGSISLANRTDFAYMQVNCSAKPSLGVYIPTKIPLKGKDMGYLEYLAHFPVDQFKMLGINSDDSSLLSTR